MRGEGLRAAYAPLVWQCRFTGIEVPDSLWSYHDFGKSEIYADNQTEHLPREAAFTRSNVNAPDEDAAP